MQMVSGLAELDREFELRDTQKPYVELIDGIKVSKSPTVTRRSLLQTVLGSWLLQWAEPYGIVGTEYRVYHVPKGEWLSVLVPDVAFNMFERTRELFDAPDLAVEIRSPDDRDRNVARKVEIYLAYGGPLVLDVHPKRKTIVAHDRSDVRTYHAGDTFAHGDILRDP